VKSIVIRQIPDDVFEWMQAQAKAIVLNPEAWLRLQLIEMARKGNQMKFDSRDGNYHGTLPNGDEVIVDGDVYAESEQDAEKEGAKLDTIESALTWENNADGESVRIVKK
jgi:hypothetical protein